MTPKLAKTTAPIHEILARRWSGRAFDRSRPLSPEQITSLLEAARWAPSCFNDQPWRYIVFDRFRNEATWKKGFACLGDWNQNWAGSAPLLLLSIADSSFQRNGKPNRWGPHDTGAASALLCVQAAALGLVAHQMGGFDARKAHIEFDIPERYTCMAMIAVGYPADAETLGNEELRELERAARERHTLGECFFDGEWGRPYAG
jgi:nitroreductase